MGVEGGVWSHCCFVHIVLSFSLCFCVAAFLNVLPNVQSRRLVEPDQALGAGALGQIQSHVLQRNKRTPLQDQSVKITNDKLTSQAALRFVFVTFHSHCLFSPTFFSCRLDSSKFRAVTLREGFWQRRVVMEDRLPLQVPCCENPGRAARRIAAADLRCCSAGCCRASSRASLVSARPSPARECLQSVRRCYFGVGVREHL